jgi:hypothetical protein
VDAGVGGVVVGVVGVVVGVATAAAATRRLRSRTATEHRPSQVGWFTEKR